MSGLAFELKDVRRSFGRRDVLRGVNGRGGRGRVIGLLGRNGEGKSTLFRVMLDLLQADSGGVRVLDLPADGSGRIRAKVGWVPERPAFHDFMTAADVLAWRARLAPGFSGKRARETAARLSLDLAQRVAGASKGTLAKLAWVCATAHDPELLLLDEPTSGLDALVREQVLDGLVGELQKRGRTILVANHHMEELAGLLDEVWVLSGGVIRAVHDADDLRRGPRRLRGRLKPGADVEGLPVVALRTEGPIVEWAALDESSARAASKHLEAFEESPLPFAQTLALLLQEGPR